MPLDHKQYPTILKCACIMLLDQGIKIEPDKVDVELATDEYDLPKVELALRLLTEDQLEEWCVEIRDRQPLSLEYGSEFEHAYEFLQSLNEALGG